MDPDLYLKIKYSLQNIFEYVLRGEHLKKAAQISLPK